MTPWSNIGSDGIALRVHPDEAARSSKLEQFGDSRTCSGAGGKDKHVADEHMVDDGGPAGG
jgi:hypothetical protein